MSSEHQGEEIVEGGACYKRVAYDGSLCLGVVECQHEQDHFELAEGVAGGVADGRGEGEETVYCDGVAAYRKDRFM